MNVNIHGQNITITPQIEAFAEDKLGKLDRYLPNIIEIRLELSRNHTRRGVDQTIAQITLRHQRGAILRSETKLPGEDRETIKKAIMDASDKMYRQIERFKGKAMKRKRQNKKEEMFIATAAELEAAEPVPIYEEIAREYEEMEEGEDNAIRHKAVEVIPMSEEDAIEQMELLGHKFFMFLNGKTGEINVVYLRDGGGYGFLQPNRV
jgi:putative sigma-54 modulation protein